MKNQFFGDARDLFKFDLVEKILDGINGLKRFSFIAMLTRDGKSEFKEDQPGGKNSNLNRFLTQNRRRGRNIRRIKEYFDRRGVDILIDCREFCHKTRKAYFDEIPKAWLSHSLILLDPDNGLEPTKPDEKHVRYEEVKEIYNEMDEKSILMIFQYRPQRKSWKACIQEKINGLKKEIKESSPVLHIRDGTIAFFFLVKNPNLHDTLKQALEAYKECYRLEGITS